MTSQIVVCDIYINFYCIYKQEGIVFENGLT